jgi:DNA polymerase
VAWAKGQGYEIPSLAKDELESVLATSLPASVRRVLELRLESAQAATKKLKSLLSWAGTDSRIRGCFKYHGASPGRWTGSGPQPQNLKKLNGVTDVPAAIAAIASGRYEEVKAQSTNPLALIGSCIRPMLLAAEGCRLVGADFSGIEARVLAWLAGETWKLAAFRAEDAGGLSVYAITAGRIYGRDPQTVTKESPEREVGKRCELAFGYAGGLGAWRAFEKYGEAISYSDAQVERFKTEWRALHPNIVGFWHALNTAAIEATWTAGKVVACGRVAFRREGCYLFLRLPSSRKIAFPYPKLICNGHVGDYVVSFKDASAGQWRDCRNGQGAYGGLFAENVTQAVARDLLAEAMIRLERAGYPIVLHCHDEAVAEVASDFGSVDAFQKIMTASPVWTDGLPIAAEGWEGARYAKA